MKLLPGAARTLGTAVIDTLEPVGRHAPHRGSHWWSPCLRDLEVGDETVCVCGLRIRRVRARGKSGAMYEVLSGGAYPSACAATQREVGR